MDFFERLIPTPFSKIAAGEERISLNRADIVAIDGVPTERQTESETTEVQEQEQPVTATAEQPADDPYVGIVPMGRGAFGNIYPQFRGKAREAIDFLMQHKEGEAVGALHHPQIGDIDLVWGDDKAGLQKIAQKHPEMMDDIQGKVEQMKVVQSSENRIVLEGTNHKAIISKMLGQKKTPQWLLTAYEKKESSASASSSDIETEPEGERNGTATPQNGTSEESNILHSKGTNSSPKTQESQDIPLKQDGTPDYAAMEPSSMFEAIAAEFDEDVAREEIVNQVKIYEAKIAKLRKNPSEDMGKRLANRKAIADLQNRINGLREAIGLVDESGVESTVETMDTPKVTLRQQSRDLGDYLSLEDKILRDIAEGQKFRWTDNGPQRGLATELGFVDSPGERKARFNILANNGITVDQYAERLEHDMDNGVIPSDWDTDVRSSMLNVLSRVRSNREAFNAAVALRENDPQTSMAEEEARQQSEYDETHRKMDDDIAGDLVMQEDEVLQQPEGDPIRDAATPIEKYRAVGELVNELDRQSGAQTYVFNDISELPQGLAEQVEPGDEIDGITWLRDSYICAPLMTDTERARRTYIHEVAGHQALGRHLSNREQLALSEAIIEDIGLEHMRSLGIPELNEEIERYELVDRTDVKEKVRAMLKLGREYIAYSTERFFTPEMFGRMTEMVFSVDLSKPVTDETVARIIRAANTLYDGRPNITITGSRETREGVSLYPARVAERGAVAGNISDRRRPDVSRKRAIQATDTANNVQGSPEVGQTAFGGNENGPGTDSRNISGSDAGRVDRTEQGALSKRGAVKRDTPAAEDIRYRAAYHGSPHDFERFDHSFMGTGEGAQAFGWGTYVTEVNGIAKSYATRLTPRVILYDGESLADVLDNEYYFDDAWRVWKKDILSAADTDELKKKISGVYIDGRIAGERSNRRKEFERQKRELLDDINNERITIKSDPRNLYTVEIPDDAGGNYLRWADDLLDAERERIVSSLSEIDTDAFDSDYFLDKLEQYEDTQNLTGEGLYKLLSKYGFDQNDQKASEALLQIGFTGIEYPAQHTIGGRADGAKNYVIFNDQDVQITDHIRFRNMAEANAAQLSPEEVNAQFNDQLQQQIDGTLPTGHIYQLGMPSAALKAAGVQDMVIELSADRLAEKASMEYASGHPFELSEVENLPQALANPIAVFDSRKGEQSKVVLTELESKGNNFVAILRVRKSDEVRKLDIEVNDIRSIYPKDRIGGIIEWIDNGLLRWVDNEKAAKFISTQWPNYIGGGVNLSGHTVDETTQQRSDSADVDIPIKGIDSATNIIKNFANPTIIEGEKSAVVETMSEELHVPIRTVTDLAQIASASPNTLKDKRGASGWYDRNTKEIVVVLPNCADVAEVQKTILHEAVGHYGIPELLGRERADELYRRVFNAVKETPRGRELFAKHQSETVAGDEYLAEMAEGNVTPGVFRRIMAAVRNFFRDVLGIDLKMTDADMRYVLWRSRHNLQNAKTVREAMQTISEDLRMRKQMDHDSARERKAAQLEKLRQASPIEISESENQYELNRKDAKEWLKENIKGDYINIDTGEVISVSNIGINEVTSHGTTHDEHLKSLTAIPEMIKQSIFIDELRNVKGNDKYNSYRYYVCGLKIDGTDYTAKVVVGIKDGKRYYDHRLTQIEKGVDGQPEQTIELCG